MEFRAEGLKERPFEVLRFPCTCNSTVTFALLVEPVLPKRQRSVRVVLRYIFHIVICRTIRALEYLSLKGHKLRTGLVSLKCVIQISVLQVGRLVAQHD